MKDNVQPLASEACEGRDSTFASPDFLQKMGARVGQELLSRRKSISCICMRTQFLRSVVWTN